MEIKTYDVKEVSKILNLSESNIRALIKQGKIKKVPIDKPIRVTEQALSDFLGMQVTNRNVLKDDEVVMKKSELLGMVSKITEMQKLTNHFLEVINSKLK